MLIVSTMFRQNAKTRWRQALLAGTVIIASALFICLFSNWWIVQTVAARSYTDAQQLPANDVALVLGASARTRGGYTNLHFAARIAAAAQLYHSGKVKHLLLSGDNHVKGYDEPSDMKDALVKLGVSGTALTLDYAGFRTLDSVVRAKEIFGLRRLTVISDDFHVPRALFLCRSYGVDAVAFCSSPVPEVYARKTRWREYAARVKALLDVYVFRTQPKFFGPQIKIKTS